MTGRWRVWAAVFLGLASTTASASEPRPLELFAQRIEPIFKSPNPSSCVQCHLSAVDLRDYILPSSRQTFLSLRDQGLIDVAAPQQSKILTLISMGEQDSDALAVRLHAKTRQAEYEAFAAWITACCEDAELVNAPATQATAQAGPAAPLAVIRHNRKDRLLDSFVRQVWSQRMRCFPCHTPHEIDANNPQHAQPAQRHAEFVEQYGQRMNLFKADPQTTLRDLIASSRKTRDGQLPLLNADRPLESLLLLKPTAKLPARLGEGQGFAAPSSALPVSHMGGIKMHQDDHSYKALAAWLQDYSQAMGGAYTTAEQLPRDNWYPTDHTLRITQAPAAWPAMSPIQVFVFAWDAQADAWQPQPIAFTQAIVTPRRMVNGSLFLLADASARQRWDALGEQLPPGKYLLKACVDTEQQLAGEPTLMLDPAQADGTAEIKAQWQTGFKNAEVVPGDQFQLKR